MRNLKRALSLALATVMTLGLMVVGTGAAAAGYDDVTSEDNVEAIEVLQAVGIMTGDENGNFNPDANVTRNEMAVIMSQLLNLDYNYYRGTNPFTDVPSWAAPYVAACAAEGVVAGIGDNLYGGDNNVTAAQASLMILKALGYFQYQADFGGDWQISTIRQASYINLFSGVDANAEQALTRNQVAQLVLNGLKADMVYFTGDVGITVNGVVIGHKSEYTSRTSADKKYNSMIGGATDIAENDQYLIQLGEELYDGDLRLRGSTDDFGRPATTWRYDGRDIGTYTDDADLTYTAGVEAGEIYSDLGLSQNVIAEDVTVYVDGDEAASTAIRRNSDTKLPDSGNGVLTEVWYDDDNNTILVTHVNTYVGTIVKSVEAKDDNAAYVVVAPENNAPKGFSGNEEFETKAQFDDDQYVLYTYSQSAGEIESVIAAEDASGLVSRSENSSTNDTDKAALTIDGTRYTASKKVAGENLGEISVDEEYIVYLDSYGYIIYVERIDEIGDYALVLATSGGDWANSHKALLVFTDGTTSVVNTDKDYGSKSSDEIKAGTIVTYRVDSDKEYTLRPVDSSKASYAASTDDLVLTNDKAGIKVNDFGRDEAATQTVTANSATTFVVRDPSDKDLDTTSDDWTAYTGIKNAPSITTDDRDSSGKVETDEQAGVYYYCRTGKMVTVMFVLPASQVKVEDGVQDTLFLAIDSVSNLKHDSNGDYFEYNAVLNGDITTVRVADDVTINGKAITRFDVDGDGKTDSYSACVKATLNGLYSGYSTDKYGIITDLETYVGYNENSDRLQALQNTVGVDKVSREYTVILNTQLADLDNNGTKEPEYTITCDENAAFYYVDEDGNITKSSYNGVVIDDDDIAYAVIEDYMVQTLVIEEVKTSANTYSADVEVNGAADKGDKVTFTASPSKVERGEDMTITIDPKEGVTVDSVTVNGRRVTLDENNQYVIENVTRNPQVEIKTSGNAVVNADVELRFVGSSIVELNGKTYLSDTTVRLAEGEDYIATVSGTTDVYYNGTKLSQVGSTGKFVFKATDGGILTVGDAADGLTLSAPEWVANTPNKDSVNEMMAALWETGSHTVQGHDFTKNALGFVPGSLELQVDKTTAFSASMTFITGWTNTNWGGTSVPVQINLPDGVTYDGNTDPNWGNAPIIWVDLDSTTDYTETISVNGGIEIAITINYVT